MTDEEALELPYFTEGDFNICKQAYSSARARLVRQGATDIQDERIRVFENAEGTCVYFSLTAKIDGERLVRVFPVMARKKQPAPVAS